MAHVVVTHDPDVRTVLDMLLHCEDHVGGYAQCMTTYQVRPKCT